MSHQKSSPKSHYKNHYLFSALEFEGGSLEHGDRVVLGRGHDAEGARGPEVHRVDRLGLAAYFTHRRSRLRHEHVTKSDRDI